MKTERLNALTDGVIAIVVTIMVLELPIPHGTDLESLRPALTLIAAYALAFVNVALFWANHHHMLQAAGHVDGRVLWANNLLLFWITLIPFVIRWIGEEGISALPVAAYGVVLVLASASYLVLERALIAVDGDQSKVQAAVGSRYKEWASFILYMTAIPMAFVSAYLSIAIYVFVAGW